MYATDLLRLKRNSTAKQRVRKCAFWEFFCASCSVTSSPSVNGCFFIICNNTIFSRLLGANYLNGEATTLHNIGGRFFEQERYDKAVPLLMQAYQIRQKIGSPNAWITKEYLNAIFERIGEARFRDILSKKG